MKTRKFKVHVEIHLQLPDDLTDATDEDREYSAQAIVQTALEDMSLPEGGRVIQVSANAYPILEKETK